MCTDHIQQVYNYPCGLSMTSVKPRRDNLSCADMERAAILMLFLIERQAKKKLALVVAGTSTNAAPDAKKPCSPKADNPGTAKVIAVL